MSKERLETFLPMNDSDTVAVQARIPRRIFDEIQKIMGKENLSWAELLTAYIRRDLKERQIKIKKAP